MSTELRKFGKYEIISRLGIGGMAEVFRCRHKSIGGFDKMVVVKRMLPERAGDPNFLRMFLDEARLTANLNHPNIVQVYEISEENGVPYIAMEFVNGPTLSKIKRSLTGPPEPAHFGHIAKIISGVADALNYVHTAESPDGRPMKLVHRDVTPQNIIVSFDGVPKLLDFGVAKAEGRLAETQAGTLKGKLRYIPPEALSGGRKIDHRGDIFSLGICLFEATVGKNPYAAGEDTSEMTILRNISLGSFARPSDLVPDFPVDIERIVLRAIEPDVNKRYQTAREFHEALEELVASGPFASNTKSLASWITSRFPRTTTSGVYVTGVTPGVTLMGVGIPQPSQGLDEASLMGISAPQESSSQSDVEMSVGTPPSGTAIPSGRYSLTSTARTAILTGAQAADLQRSGLRALSLQSGAYSQPGFDVPLALRAPPSRARTFAIGGAAIAVAIAGTALVSSWIHRTAPAAPLVPIVAPVVATKAPDLRDTDLARAYVTEAEKLTDTRRFGLALDLLEKTNKLDIRDPNVAVRIASLSDRLETQSILRKGAKALEAHDAHATIEAAKAVLDREPENADALNLLTSALRLRTRPAPVEHERPRGNVQKRSLLTVNANPSGTVYLDDEPIGKSPIGSRAIDPGEHTLQVRAQGYQPASRTFTATPGKNVSISMTLEAEVAKVPSRSAVAPAGAAISAPALKPAALVTKTIPPQGEAKVLAASAPSARKETPPGIMPPSGDSGEAPIGTFSKPPTYPLPKPSLPRDYVAKDAADLERVLGIVERELIGRSGCSPEYVQGITASLVSSMTSSGKLDVSPVAIYYFVAHDAQTGREKAEAAGRLRSAYNAGRLSGLSRMPANDRSL